MNIDTTKENENDISKNNNEIYKLRMIKNLPVIDFKI